MRAIKVYYSNGDTVTTSMNPKLTDKEMQDYFAVGRWFNIGNVTDNMQQVTKTEILK
jgi:hypothetical protein